MRKIFIYYSFIIAGLGLVLGFLTTTTYTQLLATTALFPVFLYFSGQLFPTKRRRYSSAVPLEQPAQSNPTATLQPISEPETGFQVADFDKRAFLKLIGATGLSFFLLSIFTKRGEASFFSNATGLGSTFLKDSTGKKIDPAEKQPTDGYKITEIDDDTITFYGFTNADHSWFIMKEDTQTGSFRYIKGNENFPKHWNNRKDLKYDYYNNIF